MASRRPARIAAVIREEVARRLLTEVKDPRVGPVSVVEVTVNPDLTVARITSLPLGGKGDRALIQAGLDSVARGLRGPVGRALGVRHAPELRFELDRNIEYAARMDEVFAHLPAPAVEEGGAADEADADPDETDGTDDGEGAR